MLRKILQHSFFWALSASVGLGSGLVGPGRRSRFVVAGRRSGFVIPGRRSRSVTGRRRRRMTPFVVVMTPGKGQHDAHCQKDQGYCTKNDFH